MTTAGVADSADDAYLLNLASHWCSESIRLGAEYAQAFAEETSNIRMDSRSDLGVPAEAGTAIDRRFGVGLLLRHRKSWWYGSAPLSEPERLAEKVAALHGMGTPATPELRPGQAAADRAACPVPRRALLPESLPVSAGGDSMSVSFIQDFFSQRRAVVDSAGVHRSWHDTGGRQRCTVTARSGAGRARIFTRRNAPHWSVGDIGPDVAESAYELIDAAAKRAATVLNSPKLGVRSTPVVLAPKVGAALLHELIGHALEADNLGKGSAYTSDLMGATLTEAPLHLIDDPAIPGGMGSYTTDDDGHPARRTVMVDNGTVVGRLTCMRAVYGTSETASGNGRREDYRHASLPRASNTVVLAGPDSVGTLLDAPAGGMLYVRALSSGEINLARGEFSFSAAESTFITPAGEEIQLQDVNLFGNAREALSRLSGIADDAEGDNVTCGKQGQSVRIGLHSPTMRFECLTWRC